MARLEERMAAGDLVEVLPYHPAPGANGDHHLLLVLVDEVHARSRAGARCGADGGVAPTTPRTLIHSDQGSQYGSDDRLRFCREHRLQPSMSRRGNCWDHAVSESFFSSLKKERIRRRIYRTRDMAKGDLFDYIEVFYNRSRRHGHIGGVVASAPRPSKGSLCEAQQCPAFRGKSTVEEVRCRRPSFRGSWGVTARSSSSRQSSCRRSRACAFAVVLSNI